MQVTPFGFPFGSLPFGSAAGLPGTGFAQALDQLLDGGAPAAAAALAQAPAAKGSTPAKGPTPAIELAGQPVAASAEASPPAPSTLAQLLTTATPAQAAAPASTALPEETAAQPTIDTVARAPDKPLGKPGKGAVQPLRGPIVQDLGRMPAQAPSRTPIAGEAPAEAEAVAAEPRRVRTPKETAEPAPTNPPAAPQPTVPVEALVAAAPAAPRPMMTEPAQQTEPDNAPARITRKPGAPIGPSMDAPARPALAGGAAATPDPRAAPVGDRSGAHDQGTARDEPPMSSFTLKHDAQPVHGAPGAAPTHVAAPASAPAVVPAREPELAARPGHLGQALGVEIARKVELGEESLRVRLNPGELGRIEVTLAFDDGGGLRATVRTESAHALELLRQDAPDLARTLDQAGIRADAQSFRFESRTGGDGSASPQQHQHQHRGGQNLAGHDEPEAAQPAWQAVRGDGQVDLLA